jgi:hypothetical protein
LRSLEELRMTEREIAVAKIIGPRPKEGAKLQAEYDFTAKEVAASLCIDHGHVWLETDGTPYTRHRGRTQASVAVTCSYCPATAELETFAKNTAPPIGSVPKLQ